MKSLISVAITTALGATIVAAQSLSDEPRSSVVNDAIRKFQNRDKDQPNEVKVVLDAPTGEIPAPANPGETKSPDTEPVLVTGKPPQDAAPEPPAEPDTSLEAAPKPPQQGLAVRVEKLQTGNATIDPAQIKLLAPFPAKPLSQAPAGWHLETSESAPPFTRKVEIAPGSEITLTIRPHILVPDSDGANVFTIAEPGYDASLGYSQSATVGAILSDSVRQLDENSKDLGTAIDRLQQILISLPKPEPVPDAKPVNPPARKR